jgi:hypothetical protein
MNTTLFDLNQTAATAAVSALTADALGVESIKLEAFTAAGHDRADYPTWENFFNTNLRNYTNWKKTPSPATASAAAAAAKAVPSPIAATAANKTQVAAAAPAAS